MRGQQTRRTIVSYGLEFRPLVGKLAEAPPIPEFLHPVRARAACSVNLPPEDLKQSLLTRYPEGSDIGWHTDHASFGGVVISISLLGDATLSLRRADEVHCLTVERRSLYILSGAARFEYEHRVRARSLRYSVTLRPVADGDRSESRR